MKKIFIDGSAGTTGLRIYDRLSKRDDIELIVLSDDKRKDPAYRKKALNEADVAFLCLPDAAAIESVDMLENNDTVVIDTSTAHRTNNDWAYGFPELSKEFEEKIASSKRIAVPGCHASGFIALIRPLIDKNILSPSQLLSCFSITGYSGGGKKMISEYTDTDKLQEYYAPRQYALTQQHKHLKEMKIIGAIDEFPIFCPIVDNFYSGMQVTVPIFRSQLNDRCSITDIKDVYRELYNGPIVSYVEDVSNNGFLSATKYSEKDSMAISVSGNDDRIILTAHYDNLGKGASGAALECLNIVMNKDKAFGLDI